MRYIILLLFLSACSIDFIEPQDTKTINVQVMTLDQRIEKYTVPIYSKMSVLLELIDCLKCDMNRFNPETILKHNDIIVLYPISDKRLSINQASLEELDELPGIGPSIAQRIIDYRNEHGFFQNLEDVMRIKGIKSAIYEKIKDLIRL